MTNMDYFEAGKNFAPGKKTLTYKELFQGLMDVAQTDEDYKFYPPYPWLADKLPYIECFVGSMASAVMQSSAIEFKQKGISDDDLFVQTVLTRCAWAGIGLTYAMGDDPDLDTIDPHDMEALYSFLLQDKPVCNIARAVTQGRFLCVDWKDSEIVAVEDYLEDISCFAYAAAGSRFVYGNHPELQAYCAMCVYGIAFCLTYQAERSPGAPFSWVELTVDGEKRGSFLTSIHPKKETELLWVPEYTPIYRSIGLGAPVTASVYWPKFGELMHHHDFSYTLLGNSISYKKFMHDFNAFHDCCTVEQLNQKDNVIQILCSLPSVAKMHEMYQTFDGIANVGAYEGQDPRSGKYLVELDFYPQPSLEN